MRTGALCALLVLGSMLHAATGPGVAGSPLLAVPVGARPLALGTSYVALSDDSLAALWNPAGLVQMRNPEIGLIYEQAPGGVAFGHLLYGQPLILSQAVGLVLGTLQTGDIDYRDLSGNAREVAGQSDWVLAAGYGLSLLPFLSTHEPRSFSLGAGFTVKYLWTRMGGGMSGRIPAVDAGSMMLVPFSEGLPPLRVGVAWRNMGARVKLGDETDPVASPVHFGVAQTVMESGETWTTATVECVKLLTRAEVEVHAGAEQVWKPSGSVGIAVRAGYRFNVDLPGPSGGLGVRWDRFVLDYSLSQVGELGLVKRAGLRVAM